MWVNPYWLCTLNEPVPPSFWVLAVTASIHVIIRLLNSYSGPRQGCRSGGCFSAHTEEVEWNLVSSHRERNANSLISYAETNTFTVGSPGRHSSLENSPGRSCNWWLKQMASGSYVQNTWLSSEAWRWWVPDLLPLFSVLVSYVCLQGFSKL